MQLNFLKRKKQLRKFTLQKSALGMIAIGDFDHETFQTPNHDGIAFDDTLHNLKNGQCIHVFPPALVGGN